MKIIQEPWARKVKSEVTINKNAYVFKLLLGDTITPIHVILSVASNESTFIPELQIDLILFSE